MAVEVLLVGDGVVLLRRSPQTRRPLPRREKSRQSRSSHPRRNLYDLSQDFTNLALQERRLRNQRTADIAQLTQLQKDRRDKYAADLKRALALYKSTRTLDVTFDAAFFGFVFSVEELQEHIHREQATAFVQGQPSDFTKEQFADYLAQWKVRQAA